ncbi:MAG: hypothetical protein EOP84_12540 [Verrucomicrobiaceae bacterium]|nr:MAG: hypothetical protein EOP84_12540 [Verrucomicrobiaceae bacterium]
MDHTTVIYDITTESASGGVMGMLFSLALPLCFLFFGIDAFRKSSRRVGALLIAAGALWLGMGVVSLLVAPGADYRELIEKRHYTETRGTISNFIKSSVIAGKPVATFEVAGEVFEHGGGSANYDLPGSLRNGLGVMIWHHEGRILKIVVQPQIAKRPTGQEVLNTSREAGD